MTTTNTTESILALSLIILYMPALYSQTESDEISQEQQEQQQVCAEDQVLNEETQTCESAASTTTDLGTETLEAEQQAQIEEAQAQVEEAQAQVEEGEELQDDPLYLHCDFNSDTLQVGSQGDKVIELHTFLTALRSYGHLLEPEGIDGKFGQHTKNAVMAYQKYNHLTVDGIVGPQTWFSLCKDLIVLDKLTPK